MRTTRPRRLSAMLVLSGVLAACGASGGGSAGGAPAPGALSPAEFESLYAARADSARSRHTEADVRFMTDMIHHHAQALEMARMAPTRGASAEIRTLAARIHAAQTDEIALMQAWLEERGHPVPELHEMDGRIVVHGGAHHHHDSMPGMLTPAQIESLGSLRGADFDWSFLVLMIEHHRGAVTMVRDLFATDGAARDDRVYRFATDVQAEQVTEIRRMRQMLATVSAPARTP